jgi:hypothetical protein
MLLLEHEKNMAVMAVMDAFIGISCRNQMVTSVCGGYVK